MESSGLSKFRLYSTAHIVDRVKVLDKEFEILVSNNTEVITQYYVVESSWREFPETNRIISLAQINFRLPSTPIFVKWQPCLFGLSMTKECFMGMLNNKLEK